VTQRRPLIETDTGRVLFPHVEVADRFWRRLWGLQFRRALAPGTALLLTPCASIHTCFVRFPLDLLMLDAELRVVALRRNIAPWRIVLAPRGTRAVLEMNAGECPALGVGVRVAIGGE